MAENESDRRPRWIYDPPEHLDAGTWTLRIDGRHIRVEEGDQVTDYALINPAEAARLGNKWRHAREAAGWRLAEGPPIETEDGERSESRRHTLAAAAHPRAAELFGAIYGGELEAVLRMLDEGVPADAADMGGMLPLHAAALSGEVEVLEQLLDAMGADVHAVEPSEGRTPLICAVEGGVEAVRALLDAGADPNSKTKLDDTALIKAAELGDEEMARLLLAAGADPAAVNAQGQNAASVAAGADHDDIALLLETVD